MNLIRFGLVFLIILAGVFPKLWGAPRNTIYFAYNTEPILTWDPSLEFSSGSLVLSNIYERLLRFDPISDQLIPELATAYHHNKDRLVWTFDIRRNVYFHDGSLLDAEAVKFSIERTIQLKNSASYIWQSIDDIQVINKYKIQFMLKYPAPLDQIVSCSYGTFIMSPKAVISHLPDWLSEGNEAGSGPYTLKHFKTGDQVTLSAFRNYWRGWKPNQFGKVIIKRVSSSEKQRFLIETGAVDITANLSTTDHENIEENSDINTLVEDSFMNSFFFFNTEKVPLNNKIFRKAISHAFPFQKVQKVFKQKYITPSHGFIPRGIWGHNPDLNPYPYDLGIARDLLRKSAYKKDSQSLLITYLSANDNQRKIAELFQTELKKIGIALEIQGMSWESQLQLAKNIKPENRQDILMMTWWADIINPRSWLYSLFHSQASIGYNVSYLKSQKLDTMIDRANLLEITNKPKAIHLIHQAQQLIHDEAVAIALYELKSSWAFKNNLKGFRYNPAYQDVIFFYETYRALGN